MTFGWACNSAGLRPPTPLVCGNPRCRPRIPAPSHQADGKPAAPDYFAGRCRVIRTCLNFAVRKKRLTANPLASRNLPEKWRPPKVEEQVDLRSIAGHELVAEMLTMATYVGAGQGSRFAAFFGCMFYAMMRPAEV